MSSKSHHYNPQVYLRQFVNPASKKALWEYDVQTGSVIESTPKDSGCEDYYHSFEEGGGVRDNDSIEQSFHIIENQLPKLFEVVRNQQAVTNDIWSNLFLFAALQRSRCPKALYSFRNGMSEAYAQIFEILKQSPDFDEEMSKRGLNPHEVRAEEFKITANKDATLLLLLSTFANGNLVRLFARMKWAFLIAPPGKYFFTSDDPVCCWAEPDKRQFGPIGPGHSDVEITFPLSRRVCAFAHWESVPPVLYYHLPSKNVDAVNYRTVMNGWRFVYGPIKDNLISDFVKAAKKTV